MPEKIALAKVPLPLSLLCNRAALRCDRKGPQEEAGCELEDGGYELANNAPQVRPRSACVEAARLLIHPVISPPLPGFQGGGALPMRHSGRAKVRVCKRENMLIICTAHEMQMRNCWQF